MPAPRVSWPSAIRGPNWLRLVHDHGIFYEFIPAGELDAPRPTRHWLGTAERGVNYAVIVSTCAGMWAHVIGDTIRFESLDPPLLTFTGRTRQTLSAFGEHLIGEELEGAIARAATVSGAAVRDWHVGPVFEGTPGYHQYIVEFLAEPAEIARFRDMLDAELAERNDDYRAHRTPGAGLPPPAVLLAQSRGLRGLDAQSREARRAEQGPAGGQLGCAHAGICWLSSARPVKPGKRCHPAYCSGSRPCGAA